MLQLLPGVVDTIGPDGPDRNFAIGLWINGGRRNAVGMWLDGVPTQDSGVGWITTLNVSMDALSEVKVLLNNYQAEYGRMRGAGVQMVTKSGTRDFHGSFSYFKRHEQFNANNFFNNRTVMKGAADPEGALPLQHLHLHHRRTDLHSRQVQHGTEQVVLLLVPGDLAAEIERRPAQIRHGADRTGTGRQLLANCGREQPDDRGEGPDQRAAVCRATSIPPSQHRSERPGAVEIPAAAELLRPR